MNLLHIDSSILGAHSATRELGSAIAERWSRDHPDGSIRHLDLARDPLPHLNGELIAARSTPTAVPADAALAAELAASERVLSDFLAADVVVVGAPMYNFSIPSQLKAWIDRIAVAGRTFRYTANGPEGLARGKKVVIVSARGGAYGAGTPAAALDFQENYLRGVFGFLGITDIEVVRAEGLNLGAAQRDAALAQARASINVSLPLAA